MAHLGNRVEADFAGQVSRSRFGLFVVFVFVGLGFLLGFLYFFGFCRLLVRELDDIVGTFNLSFELLLVTLATRATVAGVGVVVGIFGVDVLSLAPVAVVFVVHRLRVDADATKVGEFLFLILPLQFVNACLPSDRVAHSTSVFHVAQSGISA